jgi:transposase
LEHPLFGCPGCGGRLRLSGGRARVVQQVDVEPAKLTVQQHTCPESWYVRCEPSYQADLPEHIAKGGLVGPLLTTLIAYLKGFCRASSSTIRTYVASRGSRCLLPPEFAADSNGCRRAA